VHSTVYPTVDDVLSLYRALSASERVEFLTKALGPGSGDAGRCGATLGEAVT
jgi:hypothetical protein